jgi:hypothetical protein
MFYNLMMISGKKFGNGGCLTLKPYPLQGTLITVSGRGSDELDVLLRKRA